MARNLFGTDGVRGKANQYPIVPEVALSLGKAVVKVLRRKDNERPRIIVGKDTRISCYMLELSISSGIVSMGGEALLTGPIPTPAVAFLTPNMRCDAGVMISASHNPFCDNGIKFFNSQGFKLDDSVEEDMEGLVLSGDNIEGAPPEDMGKVRRINDALGRYIVFLKSTLPRDFKLSGLKIALDCANGATYRVAPETFYELGASIEPLGVNPDGFNINLDCGALHPENVSRVVQEKGLDLGITFDGDGDRVIIVDGKGRIIDGDKILSFLALSLKRRGELKGNKVVCTIMSNMAMEKFLSEHEIQVERCRVGDRYVLETMLKKGICLGGEQSGHIIMLSHTTTGDGILTSLQVLRFLAEYDMDPEDIYDLFQPFPQVLRGVRIKKKVDLESLPELMDAKRKIEKDLGPYGRVVIRYSGTEPLLRIMVEGENEAYVERAADSLQEVAERLL